MTRQAMYELREKFRAIQDGGPGAAPQALDELEALFLAARTEERVKEFLDEEASGVINAISCEQRVLTLALLRWMPNDELHDLAQSLCRTIGVHYLQVKAAIAFDLAGSDKLRAEAVAFRLVANAVPPAVSIGWLLSLAAAHGEAKDTMEVVDELMAYHVEELPMSTERLLTNDKNPLVSLPVACNALEHLREINAYLESLPHSRELAMPAPMRLLYASIRRERNRTVTSGAERRSFFASLFTPRHFKYSNRAAVEIHLGDRTEEQSLTMAPFSVSFELPVSEMADPISAHFQRDNFDARGKL